MCSACTSAKRGAIDAALLRGESCAVVAARYGVSRSVLDVHQREHLPEPAKRDLGQAEVSVEVPPDASPRERARLQCVRIEHRMAAAGANGATATEIRQLESSYTGATRLYARLSGALELTEAQILRSIPFQRCIAVLRAILEAHPDIARELDERLERLETAS